ncbi:MAG: hypothetical protein NC181_00440 [Clostridium sp.]|nr:hypothetical protein [Clostridium sp.]MCM1443867.1 hypothetical protein [Candidatus Amulumruptor caecigallinarius]
MKGAIGNTMVMNIVITFIVLTTAFLVASISYSKAFKVKTGIIDIIEKYDGDFTLLASNASGNQSQIMKEVEEYLGKIGYRRNANSKCPAEDGTTIAESSNYEVCIYKKNDDSETYRGNYYKVKVYMYFDFPVIGDTLRIPVTGESRTFFKEVDN